MLKQQFSINIAAPVETVRENIISDAGYRKRTSVFNPAGSWFEGNREKGSQIKFLGPHPAHPEKIGGMLSEIVENKKFEFISIKHIAEISDGEIRTDAPRTDAFENYSFSEIDGVTTVTVDIDMDMPAEFVNFMMDAWPKGLQILKEMSE